MKKRRGKHCGHGSSIGGVLEVDLDQPKIFRDLVSGSILVPETVGIGRPQKGSLTRS